MRIKKILLSLLLLTTASAVSFSSVKNSGMIINENPSVRAAGLGYAYTANTVDDVFGIFSNPAYIPPSPMIGLAYSTLFHDGKSVSEEAVGAFSFLYPNLFWGLNVGAAAVSSLEGNIENEQDSAVYLNLSGKVSFLRLGANAKYVNSKFYRDSNSDSISADAGISATFGILTIGVAGYNLFGDFVDETGEKVTPSLSAGAGLDFYIRNLMFYFELGAIQQNINQNKINPRAGFEVYYRFISLKCGYEYDNDLEDKGLLSAGLGLDIKNIILDYAFIADQNDGGTGDVHKMALSYRFYAVPKVNNEQYKQQIKYEKQQKKLAKKQRKQQAEEEKHSTTQSRHSIEDTKKSAKKQDLPLQPVDNADYGQEFFAVLAPAKMETRFGSELSVKDENLAVYQPTKTKIHDFDPALYLLELERTRTSDLNKDNSVKSKTYEATSHGVNDYDPAKELINDSDQKKKAKSKKKSKPAKTVKSSEQKNPDFKVTSKEKMKQSEVDAKTAQSVNTQVSVEDNEFDAARYILENPGKHKIKQYYVKPTKTSKDDFDAANYLIEREKRQSP